MKAAQSLSYDCISSSHKICEDKINASSLTDKIVPISIKSDFGTFFKNKFVTITGIHRELIAPIHEILHMYGTKYEYEEGCQVVIIVGKEVNETRLKSLLRKFPEAKLLEYNKELSDFVNCDYKSAITLEYKQNHYSNEETGIKENKNTILKILYAIIAVVVACAVAYFSLGFFLLLVFFVPGVAKLFLKNLFK